MIFQVVPMKLRIIVL